MDSDEIASINSDDLHRHRPNRWTGSTSTWRGLTEDERLLWQSMQRLGDQDLAAHLYNAFALKRRARDPLTAQDVTVQTAEGRQILWMPPKVWTAWPVEVKHLPREDLIARDGDEDDPFTYRRDEVKMPSSDLQEELSATVLRMAKNRFRRRRRFGKHRSEKAGEPEDVEEGLDEDEDEDEDPASPSSTKLSDTEPAVSGDESEGHHPMKLEAGAIPDSEYIKGRQRKRPRTYRPVVSTDDDLSYDIIKPPVRHILSRMDKTLDILHILQSNGASYQSDSSTDAESDSGPGQASAGPKRPRGRPRSVKTQEDEPTHSTTKRGRPKKARLPLEGESHLDFLARVARESHRRIPTEVAFEEWLRAGEEAASREQSQAASEAEREDKSEAEDDNKSEGTQNEEEDEVEEDAEGKATLGKPPRRRLRLRDWSDVIGAASIAGFSPQVIARTAKRCADLFGEGMVIRRLDEVPASLDTGVQTTECRPEPIRFLSSSSEEEDSQIESDIEPASSNLHLRRHVASRQSSQAPSSSPSPSTRSRSRSRSRPLDAQPSDPGRSSRSRSTSRSSVGQHFCPVMTCERSTNGFGRKTNLKRHMDLVHGGMSEHAVMDQDSDDEVVGAVHVDGFLKTLKQRRGWRAEDMLPRKRQGYHGQRKGKEAAAITKDDIAEDDDERDSS